MKNILKLTGVSMLAIIAATNANAAGYTCESLIEYESCNPGYALTINDTRCSDGYTYTTELCLDETDEYSIYTTQEACVQLCREYADRDGLDPDECVIGTTVKYLTAACVRDIALEDGHIYQDDIQEITNTTDEKTCNECPVGFYCAGGTAAAELCSGETYADETGLAACKSCRDAAGTIGVTSDMITGITGGTTCEYDLKVSKNHGVYNIQCILDKSYDGGGNACRIADGDSFTASDFIKCDAGYYMDSSVIDSDCNHDYFNYYYCSGGSANFAPSIDEMLSLYSCVVAPLGTYSTGGWDYQACPTTGLTDVDGKSVAATTLSTGATSVSECVVPSGVSFKDEKGVYGFKSTCAYDAWMASTDGTCQDGYMYLGQDRIMSEGPGTATDCASYGVGCFRIPDGVTDTETCEYWFTDDSDVSCSNAHYLYCDGENYEL